MNIKINKKQYNNLLKLKHWKLTIGSHFYGTNNDKSDKDYLIIYIPTIKYLLNPLDNHHQFQYDDEDNNIDYIFIDIKNFISNIISGDSTINYELLFSEELRNNNDLSFLYYKKEIFYSYNILNSFCGLMKRDISDYKKSSNKERKNKKLKHIIRANEFLTNNLSLEKSKLSIENINNLSKNNNIFKNKINLLLQNNLIDKFIKFDKNINDYLINNLTKLYVKYNKDVNISVLDDLIFEKNKSKIYGIKYN